MKDPSLSFVAASGALTAWANSLLSMHAFYGIFFFACDFIRYAKMG